MLRSGPRDSVPSGGAGRPGDPARELLEAACTNARTLARVCDVLEAGPALIHGHPGHELVHVGEPDGAWILPEEI